MPDRAVPFKFAIMDGVAAELAGVPMAALHTDVDAICRAADAVAPLADRLGVPRPRPRLAGLGYVHVSALGAAVTISPDAAEPYVTPCLRSPGDIDRLREPDDYLAAGLAPSRLVLLDRLRQRRPDAVASIGHDLQGPVTTAALLMGPDFFMLAHDDPARAHRLMDFCTTSAIHFCRAINRRLGGRVGNGPVGFPDDFAGFFKPDLFAEFVVPYWQRIFEELGATERSLHCELLHEEHMPFLEQLKIDSYDPSVNQYLPAETLKRACRVGYGLRIWPAWVQDQPAEKLVSLYRRYAADRPQYVMFHLHRACDESKIAALLSVARELAGKSSGGT